MSAPVRVLIADDHQPMRHGIRLALERSGFVVCAECADAWSALAAARRLRPDVCLLDIRMPGGGVAAAEEITASVNTVVIMITVSEDDNDLFAALKAGASGYLLKDIEPHALPAALRGALAGEAALPRTLVTKLITEFQRRGWRRRLPSGAPGGEELTNREWDVLELLAKELDTAEIAEALHIARPTVRTHISMILRKLRVSSREAAVRLMQSDR